MNNWILTIISAIFGLIIFAGSFIWLNSGSISERKKPLTLHLGLTIILAALIATLLPVKGQSYYLFSWVNLFMFVAGLVCLLLCGLSYRWLRPGMVLFSGLFIGSQYSLFTLIYVLTHRVVHQQAIDPVYLSSFISFSLPYIFYLLWYTYRSIPGRIYTLTPISNVDRPVIDWARGEENIFWQLNLILENGFSIWEEVSTPIREDLLDFIKREIITCHRQHEDHKILPPSGAKSYWLFKKRSFYFWKVVIDPQSEGARIKNGSHLFAYRMDRFIQNLRPPHQETSPAEGIDKKASPARYEIVQVN